MRENYVIHTLASVSEFFTILARRPETGIGK